MSAATVTCWQGKTYEQVLEEHRPAMHSGKFLGMCSCYWADKDWADLGGNNHPRHLAKVLADEGFELVNGEPRVLCGGPRAIRRRETAEAMLVTEDNTAKVLGWLDHHLPEGKGFLAEEGSLVSLISGKTVARPGQWIVLYENGDHLSVKILDEERYRRRYTELGRA